MNLWHYNLINELPDIELYYSFIIIQAVINQTILLTNNYRLENNPSSRKYHGVSDALSYRKLILHEMKKRKLPIWKLKYPWPYERFHYRKKVQVRSYPMDSKEYYLNDKRGKTAKFPFFNKFNKRSMPVKNIQLNNPINKYPNLLVGCFTNRSYLQQYAELLKIKNMENWEEKVKLQIAVLKKLQEKIRKGDHTDHSITEYIDNDIIMLLIAVYKKDKLLCLVDEDGKLIIN